MQNEDCRSYWWVEKTLTMDDQSMEALLLTKKLLPKLIQQYNTASRMLQEKTDYLRRCLLGAGQFRRGLSDALKSTTKSTIPWASLQSLKLWGMPCSDCIRHLAMIRDLMSKITGSLSKDQVDTEQEYPQALGDQFVVTSYEELSVVVNTKEVEFFKVVGKQEVLNATQELINIDQSLEVLANGVSKVRTWLDNSANELTTTLSEETVDQERLVDFVQELNTRLLAVNRTVNAAFVVQAYAKVLSVIFTDALANIK